MCCMLHNQELMRLGFDADIDLEEQRVEEPPETKIYLWLPTKDRTPPAMNQLWTGAAALQEMVKRNLKVYVHCRNGHGRAPTLVAAYLVTTGISPEEAVAFIKARRPSIHLQESQVVALKEFAKS